jgi:hypothetical protein
MPFDDHDPFGEALRALLDAERSSELEERSLCLLSEASLRLAYPGATSNVGPAPDRVKGATGVLEVRLVWPLRVEPPLVVRVVVHDELARGAWREASIAIGDAMRAALLARDTSDDSEPKREGPLT